MQQKIKDNKITISVICGNGNFILTKHTFHKKSSSRVISQKTNYKYLTLHENHGTIYNNLLSVYGGFRHEFPQTKINQIKRIRLFRTGYLFYYNMYP